MTRSHPPSLHTIVRNTLKEECGELAGRNILAAVSGGSDSQAMLTVLARLSPEFGFKLFAHGVNHGLRKEAGLELDIAEELANNAGVPFSRTNLNLSYGSNLQARAREVRYNALREIAEPLNALIATAHHANDRAETVLLRLLRGAGPRGLAVLAPRTHDIIRPLIKASKEDVELHLKRHNIKYAEDPSNKNKAFMRVRVRYEVLPLLKELSPQIIKHINDLSDQLDGRDLPDDLCELNRAQIKEVLKAKRLKKSVVIRVAGGNDVRFGK